MPSSFTSEFPVVDFEHSIYLGGLLSLYQVFRGSIHPCDTFSTGVYSRQYSNKDRRTKEPKKAFHHGNTTRSCNSTPVKHANLELQQCNCINPRTTPANAVVYRVAVHQVQTSLRSSFLSRLYPFLARYSLIMHPINVLIFSSYTVKTPNFCIQCRTQFYHNLSVNVSLASAAGGRHPYTRRH